MEISEKLYCYCRGPEEGDIVGCACDNRNCQYEWFHLTCLGLSTLPIKKNWYCPDCRKLSQFSKLIIIITVRMFNINQMAQQNHTFTKAQAKSTILSRVVMVDLPLSIVTKSIGWVALSRLNFWRILPITRST